MRYLPAFLVALLVPVAAFGAALLTQVADPFSAEALQPLIDAVVAGKWISAAIFAVNVLVLAVRKFSAPHTFVNSDRGGALLALVSSLALGLGAAALAGPLTLPIVIEYVIKTLFGAVAGYTLLKKLLFGDAEKIKADAARAGEKSAAALEPKSPLEIANGQ